MSREFHYQWEWQLQSSPQKLWPFVADTNRFDRDVGLPAIERLQSVNQSRLKIVMRGMPLEWEENPFEWIYPVRYGVVRRYFRGPIAQLRILVQLLERSDGGTRLIYEIGIEPKSVFGKMTIPFQIGFLTRRQFFKIFKRYDELALQGQSNLETPSGVRLTSGGDERLEILKKELTAQGENSDLVDRLIQVIKELDDLSLVRMRPYEWADLWGFSRRVVLEFFLKATRAGLLELRWDLLCPLCRGTKEGPRSLKDINPQVHCESCNIDFTVNFDRLVEVTFRPNPAIRKIEVHEFCIGGPQITPHVIAQQSIPSGVERSLTLKLERGRYRLRALKQSGEQFAMVSPEGMNEVKVQFGPRGWKSEELRISESVKLHLMNLTEKEQVFIFERMAWMDQAATAAEVIALQKFRDLFSQEVLRPGDQISVGSLCVLFTDLRSSTRLYREIGDAPAFGVVMNHFDILKRSIAEEEGSLVKTIGDAVMAVFRRPVAALRAMLRAQRDLASPSQGVRPLMLKAGIHYGPCIAVNLNDRLDYFGSTVNMAARLESLSSGQDVIVSHIVRADPEVSEMFAQSGNGLKIEPLIGKLKGFDEESIELSRVSSLIS